MTDEELRTLRAFRTECAATLQRLDDWIADVERARRPSADDVRQRQLDNARLDGEALARTELYATVDAERELRSVFREKYRGDRVLVDEALAGASDVWRTMSNA